MILDYWEKMKIEELERIAKIVKEKEIEIEDFEVRLKNGVVYTIFGVTQCPEFESDGSEMGNDVAESGSDGYVNMCLYCRRNSSCDLL